MRLEGGGQRSVGRGSQFSGNCNVCESDIYIYIYMYISISANLLVTAGDGHVTRWRGKVWRNKTSLAILISKQSHILSSIHYSNGLQAVGGPLCKVRISTSAGRASHTLNTIRDFWGKYQKSGFIVYSPNRIFTQSLHSAWRTFCSWWVSVIAHIASISARFRLPLFLRPPFISAYALFCWIHFVAYLCFF